MAYIIRRLEVDFVLLAGYLQLIPVELIQAYPRSIVNIHPSLLPAFGGKGNYGMRVHKAVIASGARYATNYQKFNCLESNFTVMRVLILFIFHLVRYSGPTIHFVDEHYDTGRILAQRVVPVLANDTAEDLAARVLKEVMQFFVPLIFVICLLCSLFPQFEWRLLLDQRKREKMYKIKNIYIRKKTFLQIFLPYVSFWIET